MLGLCLLVLDILGARLRCLWLHSRGALGFWLFSLCCLLGLSISGFRVLYGLGIWPLRRCFIDLGLYRLCMLCMLALSLRRLGLLYLCWLVIRSLRLTVFPCLELPCLHCTL